MLRYIARRDAALNALFLTNVAGLAISGGLAPFVWRSPSAAQWELMAVIGVIAATGQLFFVRAASIADASLLAPVLYSTLVYAAVFGYLVFEEVPGAAALTGAALIVGAGIVLGRAERRTPI